MQQYISVELMSSSFKHKFIPMNTVILRKLTVALLIKIFSAYYRKSTVLIVKEHNCTLSMDRLRSPTPFLHVVSKTTGKYIK
jgi:hypothetical protein